MKSMKIALAAVAFLAASIAQAGNISGNVGVASNYINEGQIVGDKNINPTLNVGASVAGPMGLFVDGGVNVIDMNAGLTDMLYRTEIGGGVVRTITNTRFGYGVRVSRVNYFGGETGDAADMNHTDVAAWVSYGDAYAGAKRTVSSDFGDDMYYKVGYLMPVTTSLDVGVAAAWKQYDVADVTRFNNAEITATYSLTKSVAVTAMYSVGGKDAADADIKDRVVVGMNYLF